MWARTRPTRQQVRYLSACTAPLGQPLASESGLPWCKPRDWRLPPPWAGTGSPSPEGGSGLCSLSSEFACVWVADEVSETGAGQERGLPEARESPERTSLAEGLSGFSRLKSPRTSPRSPRVGSRRQWRRPWTSPAAPWVSEGRLPDGGGRGGWRQRRRFPGRVATVRGTP